MTDKSAGRFAAGGRRSLLLCGAALLPFVWAVVSHAKGPRPQTVRPVDEPPGLVFEQYLINLGEVPPIPMLEGRFRFTNRSRHTLTIKELKPSCGCLNPRLAKRIYQPGESGEFFVRVQTAGEKPGPKEYYVDVHYEDSEPRQLQLAFDFVLPERKVVVHPRALIFYQLGAGSTTRDIVVSDYRQVPLRVTGWECKSPYVSVSIGESQASVLGYQETTVRVTVADGVPPGKHQALLNLKTDDKTTPLLRVPLWIQGPEKPRSKPGS